MIVIMCLNEAKTFFSFFFFISKICCLLLETLGFYGYLLTPYNISHHNKQYVLAAAYAVNS